MTPRSVEDRPTLLFAANWKMHLGPAEARDFAQRFLAIYHPTPDRETWFFPSAVSLEAMAVVCAGIPGTRAGVQDVYWEAKGAFTGATSVALARAAGASTALIGHSERRHVFGETDADTARKLRAVLDGALIPLLCVGEKLEERERGETERVVHRQLLAAVQGLTPAELDGVVIAYEPVWAIGTGRTATPEDAATVHRTLRERLIGMQARKTRILYGGSVSGTNIRGLLAEPEIDGVLVGGASLDPSGWAGICSASP